MTDLTEPLNLFGAPRKWIRKCDVTSDVSFWFHGASVDLSMSPFLLICRDCEFGSNDQTAIEKPSHFKGASCKVTEGHFHFFFVILKPMSTTYMDLIRGEQ